MKLTKALLEQMIREAAEDDPQQWLSPDVEEDDVDLDKDDWNIGDPEPLWQWFSDILIRRVQDALQGAAKDIAEEVDFDKEYKEHLLDTVGINIEEDLLDFLRPVAELLADGNQKYPDPLAPAEGIALRTKLAENNIEEGDVIDLGAEREKRASEKEREEVDYAVIEEKASELAQSVLLHLLENKFVDLGEPPYGESDPVVVLVDGIRESLKVFLLSQGGGLSEGEDSEAERVEMEDKIARRLKARKKGNVEDLMGSSFENSIARIKARVEKEEDPSKKRDLEKMLATQEKNLAMMTEGKFDDRMRGAGKIHDLLVDALVDEEVFPMGQISEQVLKAILNLSLRIWDESVVEENVEKNHAQVSEAQFQMARADMESKMLEDAAKNILNVLLLKHKLSKEDQHEYKEDIKSGIENIIKMLRKEMV